MYAIPKDGFHYSELLLGLNARFNRFITWTQTLSLIDLLPRHKPKLNKAIAWSKMPEAITWTQTPGLTNLLPRHKRQA